MASYGRAQTAPHTIALLYNICCGYRHMDTKFSHARLLGRDGSKDHLLEMQTPQWPDPKSELLRLVLGWPPVAAP